LLDIVADPSAPALDATMLEDSDRSILAKGIANLPEQQRVVLALYYHRSLTLRQIAEVLHVTESRVSQIRSAAIRKLRESIREELVP
jgi:RNA polymerase sigma factor for flagellar operon FliA